MDRRTFLLGTAGLLAASPGAGGQPSKVAKVGILLYGTPQADPNLADLRRSLRDLGCFVMLLQAQRILDFASRNRVPLAGGWGPVVRAGRPPVPWPQSSADGAASSHLR